MPITSVESRFWPNVLIGDSCWEWQGTIGNHGYGIIGETLITMLGGYVIKKKTMELVHRISYKMWYGNIPNNLHILHRCDNKKCCRPDHLFAGTNQDNVTDKVSKNRQAKGEMIGFISNEQVLEIKQLLANGNTQTSIAEKFNCNQCHISRIANNLRRKEG